MCVCGGGGRGGGFQTTPVWVGGNWCVRGNGWGIVRGDIHAVAVHVEGECQTKAKC